MPRLGRALATLLLPRLAAGALVSMRGASVPACRDYAAQLNTLFPADPGTELLAVCVATPAGVPANPWQDAAGVIYAFSDNSTAGPAAALAAAFEGEGANPAAVWTAPRVRARELAVNRTSAQCPCAAPFRCTGAVGNVSTCERSRSPLEMCFDGASATCSALVAAGCGAAAGGLLALLGELIFARG